MFMPYPEPNKSISPVQSPAEPPAIVRFISGKEFPDSRLIAVGLGGGGTKYHVMNQVIDVWVGGNPFQ